MKKYFLKNEDGQIGPFGPEELKEKGIEPGTPIWYEGLEQWTTAGELDELKEIFSIPAESVPEVSAPAAEPEPAAVAAVAEETVSDPLPATEPIVTAAAPVAAPIVAAATDTAATQAAAATSKPARRKGNPVISWALSLAVLGGAGYYVYQDMEKNKDSAPVVQGQEITISDTDLQEEKKDEIVLTDSEAEKQEETMGADTVTAPVTEEKKETVTPPVTVPVTDPKKAEAEKKAQALAKKAEEDKKKKLAAEAKKKEEEKKKLLAAQAQAAKEMAMRNAWQSYITIGPYKIEGDDKVKPFAIPVYNAFPVSVDKVTLRVDYIKKEKIVATETLTLGSIPAKGNLQVQATGNKKGHTANVYITGAGSRALHFCFPSNGGKPGDQYYCN